MGAMRLFPEGTQVTLVPLWFGTKFDTPDSNPGSGTKFPLFALKNGSIRAAAPEGFDSNELLVVLNSQPADPSSKNTAPMVEERVKTLVKRSMARTPSINLALKARFFVG